jgi:rhamnulokinase
VQGCRRQWQREGMDYSWDALAAQAKQAQPFRSLVDPDASEFLNPPHMVDALRAYCAATNQPVPETVGEVVRCCLESLALRYRWVLEALESLVGRRLETIRIVGGGSRNRLLSQFAADACNRVVVTGPVEATALGNVMLQAIAAGEISTIAEGRAAIAASIQQERFEPSAPAPWDEAYARFMTLVKW